MAPRTDPRYGSGRWKKVRELVLARDRRVCRIVAGCRTRATIADHVIPVYEGMPDALFFGLGNLRAACRDHNLARAAAAKLEAPAERDSSSVVSRDYSREPVGAR